MVWPQVDRQGLNPPTSLIQEFLRHEQTARSMLSIAASTR
jgi:hypothetical protein